MVVSSAGGEIRDLTPDYPGHVQQAIWLDERRVVFVGARGVWTELASVDVRTGKQQVLVPTGGPILRSMSASNDRRTLAFIADTPNHPAEVYARVRRGQLQRLTTSNAELASTDLAGQSIVSYVARDGLELEGLLIRPMDAQPGQRYPLLMIIHGGPESHFSNGWITRYANPGQVAAGQGYAVFYPNYRGSTAQGVAFSKLGQGDYADGEFNDLVDAVDHLVEIGLVDRDRVGISGGSYGGYASMWAATALSEHFAASVAFVGISDQISKVGTTDIPSEMYLVHARRWPWDGWMWLLQRSPIYHAEKSRTPTLILAGKEDPRVHPSQSLEMYRYLKLRGQAPVRLIYYPGEQHGNQKTAARLDYSQRFMRWMDHYLKGPGGEPPPHELPHAEELERIKVESSTP